MRTKDYNDILANVQLTSDSLVPFVDGDFIVELPLYHITGGDISNTGRTALAQFASIDLLSGVTSSDAALFITERFEPLLKTMGLDIANGVPRDFFIRTFLSGSPQEALGQPATSGVSQAFIHEYTNWKAPDDAVGVRGQMIDFSTDFSFLLPAVTIARIHSNLTIGTPRRTFLYEVDHKASFDPLPLWLRGAKHGAEVPFVFGFVDELKVFAGIPPSVSNLFKIPDQENYLALVMLTMWTNFAKTGNPNSASLTNDNVPTWTEFDPVNGSYFRFISNITSSEVTSHHLSASRVAFWTELVPALLSVSNCTQQHQRPISASLRENISVVSVMMMLTAWAFFRV
ncbi:acetylcholinesterase-like [Dreissena polymorpha]|uniref:Carboxylesterase type B domain-containing protein n=1 Tax=Dreissena polymorpha TaxID=45954 RepID=A0A9D4CS67_DREPO|nr:acetylcholinesterase-like [Dreissena polymorpha]KAH3729368.1 hypothetical protein DPMN_055336 [Dreissena polymorpha]